MNSVNHLLRRKLPVLALALAVSLVVSAFLGGTSSAKTPRGKSRGENKQRKVKASSALLKQAEKRRTDDTLAVILQLNGTRSREPKTLPSRNGIILGDRMILGDGIIISDGIILGDGIVSATGSSSATASFSVTPGSEELPSSPFGDNTARMEIRKNQ